MTAENTRAHASPGARPAPPQPLLAPPQPSAANPAPPATPNGPGVPSAPGAPGGPGGPGAPAPAPKGRKARRGAAAQAGGKRSRWHFFVDRGSELLAAILTLVAAVLGIWGAQLNNENGELADKVDTLEDAGSVLRDDNASLADDLADMTASRDTWKQRAEAAENDSDDDTTTSTTAPETVDPEGPTGTVPNGAAGVFRQTDTPVTFASGYGIDLDSQESNWSVGSGGDVYLLHESNGYRLDAYGQSALVSQPASFEQCDAQTVLQSGGLTKEQTVVGRQFCTVTSEGRWAYVKVVGFDPDRGTITLHVVVWTLQTD